MSTEDKRGKAGGWSLRSFVPPGFDFRNSRGWFRVWILLSLAWIGYGITQSDPPWIVERDLYREQLVYQGQTAEGVAGQLIEYYRSDCAFDPIEARVSRFDPPPKPPANMGWHDPIKHYQDRSAYDDKLRKWQYSLAGFSSYDLNQIKELSKSPPTARVNITCTSKKIYMKWANTVFTVLGPPIIIPFILFLLYFVGRGLLRWITDGFHVTNASAAPLSPNNSLETMVAVDTVGKKVEPILPQNTADLSQFKTAMNWSVVGATFFDQFIRAIASGGASRGTNLLIFALIALIIYYIARPIILRRPQGEAGTEGWIALFIVVSFFVMGITVFRYT